MICRLLPRPRRGAMLVECAFIFPITFLLLLGLVIGGMGIFRYQEAAALARAGARYASTHGNRYRRDSSEGTGSPSSGAATTALTTSSNIPSNVLWYNANTTSAAGSDTSWTGDIYDQAIRSNMVAFDPSYLTVQVGWPPVSNVSGQSGGAAAGPDNWPGSVVYVTVSYNWMPELFVVGPIRLQSTASCPVTN